MTAFRTRGLIALVIALASLALAAQALAAEATLTGDIPGNDRPGGVALVQWSGGSIDELVVAAEGRECRLRSAWITAAGEFVGYVVGAPDFANAAWASEVGPVVEARTLLVVCSTPGLDSCPSVHAPIFDYAVEAVPVTPREALDEAVLALSQFPDTTPPDGTFVQVSASDATPESAATVVYELVSHDGIVVGRATVIEGGGGWLFSGSEMCSFPDSG